MTLLKKICQSSHKYATMCTNKPFFEVKMSAGPGRHKLVTSETMGALYDTDNPEALINRLPERLKPILERVKVKLPKTLLKDERAVRQYCQPDDRDQRVRLAFWDEYNACTSGNRQMSLNAIISGAVSWESWVAIYEPSDKKMCWIFTPPNSYVNMMRHILHEGTNRLLEIMKFPMVDAEGKVDIKVANLVMKAFQLADMRIKGGIVQNVKIDQRTLQVNASAADMQIEGAREDLNGLSLKELERLESRIEKAKKDGAKFLGALPDEEKAKIIEADYELEDRSTRCRERYKMPKVAEVPNVVLDIRDSE